MRDVWDLVFRDRRALSRLGIRIESESSTASPTPASTEALPRLVSIMLHLSEARMWSGAWQSHAWPGKFAALLVEDSSAQADAFLEASQAWEAFLSAEQMREIDDGMAELWEGVHWLQWPVVQFTFRMLAHYGFRPHPEILAHVTRMFKTLGDTKVDEDAHCASILAL